MLQTAAEAPRDLEKVKQYWDQESGTWEIGRGIHWTEHTAVQQRINQMVSGSPHTDPYRHLIAFLKSRGVALPLGRCLTLGCGGGELERGLAKYNLCRRHDAYDISPGSIELAQQTAHEQRLHHIDYQVADINRIAIPPDTYDVVFAVMSAHHFSDLEDIFSQVRRSLKPGGLFFLNEFVGPTKFQWTDRQLEIVNGLLQVLPPAYRMMKDGQWKTSVQRPTLPEMDAIDPSEAVRSGEILNALSLFFNIAEKKDYGGTILHLLLEGIAFNFNGAPAGSGMRLLQTLFDVEDQLLQLGDITSDFSVIIAE